MKRPVRVSIVIPTYNEKENIQRLIPKIEATKEKAHVDLHIIVVDDASPDGTAEEAEKFARKYRNITVLRRSDKLGIGSAYKYGFKVARSLGCDVLLEMDADLSHNPKFIADFVEKILQRYDLVIGSRYIPGGSIPGWPLRRRMVSKGANFLARLLLGLDVKDVTSGYRAFDSKTLRKVDFSSIKSDGYMFQVETIYRYKKAGLKIGETPITFFDRRLGMSKLGSKEVLKFAGGLISLLIDRIGLA